MANICIVIAVHTFMLSSNKDNAEQLGASVQVGKGLAGQPPCWKGPGDYSECRLNLYSAIHFHGKQAKPHTELQQEQHDWQIQ